MCSSVRTVRNVLVGNRVAYEDRDFGFLGDIFKKRNMWLQIQNEDPKWIFAQNEKTKHQQL